MACAAGLLTLAGPFGTGTRLTLLPLFLYWSVLVAACYSAGFIVSGLVARRLAHRPLYIRLAVASLGIGTLVTGLVIALNALVFGFVPALSEIGPLALVTFATAALVTLAIDTVHRAVARPEDAAPPAILDRLPLDKRGALLALSVEDHYVRVRTDAGEEMVLMRLADAIREVGDVPGLQVHRSHWVALGAVTAAARAGDRAILTLSDGAEIPVSRANLPAVREAGLLPR
ncbi:hypothetical protein ATO11_14600 [Pseudaestuariivita atlantica]|uniref:HTH LytTR-type domain-containing protein n=2 Tax=Pseudaestuariivita atlantica TaxID=1317121 RepID=A0A0L1JN41_9RHOB|nr:hypothetical protein ATO11_14600 [Pseudaestuariivita atlantica]